MVASANWPDLSSAAQMARFAAWEADAARTDEINSFLLQPRSLLLLSNINNTLQLVSRSSGISESIYAPGRYGRRMLGSVRGASEPPGDDDGIIPGKETEAFSTLADGGAGEVC